MNFPEPISPFMTSSCSSCLSISKQAINIKMKFFCMSYQSSWHQLFSQMFSPAISERLFINLLSKAILFWLLSYHKSFFLPPHPFSWKTMHEYHFTLHCGCISIDQKIIIKKKTWRMCHDPAELRTTETHVMIALCLIQWQKTEAYGHVSTNAFPLSYFFSPKDASSPKHYFQAITQNNALNFLQPSWHAHQARKNMNIDQS